MERTSVLGRVDSAANLGTQASLKENPKFPGRLPPQADCFRLSKRQLPKKRRHLLGREPHLGRFERPAAPQFALRTVQSCVRPAAQ